MRRQRGNTPRSQVICGGTALPFSKSTCKSRPSPLRWATAWWLARTRISTKSRDWRLRTGRRLEGWLDHRRIFFLGDGLPLFLREFDHGFLLIPMLTGGAGGSKVRVTPCHYPL